MGLGREKVRLRLIISILTITLGVVALAQANSQSASSANIQRSTTRLVSSATPPTGAYFDHVVVILMENEGVHDICNDSPPPCLTTEAPYMAGLANNYTIGSQYLSLITTSQPNYVALISGSTQGCTSSCPIITAPNLVDRFEAAGLAWKGYFENMTFTSGSCNGAINSPAPYTQIHNPFVPFQDITNNTARCNKIVDANPNSCGSAIDCVLVNDLNNATAPAPNFMWLTPNDCDNMRGSSVCSNGCGVVNGTCISTGNAYLSRLVPLVLKSRAFTTTRSALFITFDEGNGYCPPGSGNYPNGISEDCVYASWAGPVAKTGFATSHLYDHYSFTKTIEANWNLAGFTLNDTNAIPMTEFFKNQPVDFTVQQNPGFANNHVNPTSPVIAPVGSRSNSTIIVSSIDNFTGTVNLTASSSPTGPSLTLTPASIGLTAQATSTSTLTFSSSSTGAYTVTVTGSSGSLSHAATLTFSVVPPNFAISATPTSLSIGLASTTTNGPVTVSSTGDPTFFQESHLANSFYAKGLIWLFYGDSRFTCEHQSGCLTYTTSTNGSAWASVTRVPVHIVENDFSVSTNGTSVFYVRYNETSFESACGQRIQLGLGTLNTSGTVSWQPERTVAVGAANRDYPNDEIIVDSNNQVWIGYMIDNHTMCGGDGTDTPQVIHSSGTNYAVWTGNTTLTTAHSDNWQIALVSLGNGQVYASYWIINSDLHGRLYNGAAWCPDEQISYGTTRNDVNAWLFNSGTNVYAIYFDNATETYKFASRSSAGVWAINTIGAGESHTGTLAFSPSYYSLPDSASYDAKDNLFDIFYINATLQRIDQWSGSGSTWTKTTGLIGGLVAPYPDGISSFIQSSPTIVGAIFYTSGSSFPFTINSASLVFKPATNTGTFTVTVTSQNGFTATVSLSRSVSPSTGLAIGCNPTSIPGGSGSSTCNLTASAQGNFNATVTGTSGSLVHSVTVAVSVMPYPDFAISATSPASVNASQPFVSTITITALNGFAGTVLLTAIVPTGLNCGPITPTSITGAGNASLTYTGLTPGNYNLTIVGTSGTLSHVASLAVAVGQSGSLGGVVVPPDQLKLLAQFLPATITVLAALVTVIAASWALAWRKRRSKATPLTNQLALTEIAS